MTDTELSEIKPYRITLSFDVPYEVQIGFFATSENDVVERATELVKMQYNVDISIDNVVSVETIEFTEELQDQLNIYLKSLDEENNNPSSPKKTTKTSNVTLN